MGTLALPRLLARSIRLGLLTAPLLAMTAEAGGPAVPTGTFWVHEGTVAGSPRSSKGDAIELTAETVSTLSGCPPTRVTRGTNREGLATIAARWPRCKDAVNVAVEATIDETGVTLIGRRIIDENVAQLIATQHLGDAIRIGTYNVQFFATASPPYRPKKPRDAAKKIAERVKASRYDIIGFTEVWNEDAKDGDGETPGLVHELKATYPYYAQYLDGDQFNPHEDSGLMLFSRFPFEVLPHATHVIDNDDCKASPDDDGDACDKIAFFEFDSCDDDDCLAEKGAGLVRLRNPQSGAIYNVVFTHLQAPYFDDSDSELFTQWQTQKEQMGEIQRLIEDTLDPENLSREEVFVIGDLNIDGDRGDANKGTPSSQNHDSLIHNRAMWAELFDTPGSFFFDRLRDVASFDTSPADPLVSAPRHYEPFEKPKTARVDYILRNQRKRGLCVQHVSLAHNLRWGDPYVESGLGQPGTEAGAAEMSDHLGLTGDFGPAAKYCSAAAPRVLPLPAGPLVTVNGKIKRAGNMQWYRFDEPGTYGFAVEGGDVALQVFAETDLSMPLANYKQLTKVALDRRGKPHTLTMYEVPAAPFYVRAFEPGYSGYTGNYKLQAKRYDCSSQSEACLLSPGASRTGKFPAGTVVGADDAYWYELHTEAAGYDTPTGTFASGVEQTLGFEVDRIAPANATFMAMSVRAEDGTTVLADDASATADTAEPDYATAPTNQLTAALDEASVVTRFIRVQRSNPSVEIPFRVGWHTNLTVLHGSQVGVPGAHALDFSIFDHGDEFYAEEFYFTLIADGQTVVDNVHLGDFEEPSNMTLEAFVTAVRFVDSARVIFQEVDNDYDGPIGHTPDPDDDDDYVEVPISPLAPTAPCAVGKVASLTDDEEGGSYHFTYNLCHGVPVQ
jgi:Endonuclease/Exonuclease/phosphatase family